MLQTGNKVKGYEADVADEQAVVTLFENIERDFGGIGGLINNAGITKDRLLVKVHEGTVTLPCAKRERATPYGFSSRRDGLAPRGHRRGA